MQVSSSIKYMSSLSGIWPGTWGRGAGFAALVGSNRRVQRRAGRWCPLQVCKARKWCSSLQPTRTYMAKATTLWNLPPTWCCRSSLITRLKWWDCQAMPLYDPWLRCTASCITHLTKERHCRQRTLGSSGIRSSLLDRRWMESNSRMRVLRGTRQKRNVDGVFGERRAESVDWWSWGGPGCLDCMAIGPPQPGWTGVQFPWIFEIVIGTEGAVLYVCLGSL